MERKVRLEQLGPPVSKVKLGLPGPRARLASKVRRVPKVRQGPLEQLAHRGMLELKDPLVPPVHRVSLGSKVIRVRLGPPAGQEQPEQPVLLDRKETKGRSARLAIKVHKGQPVPLG